jgi:hypothetical protein
MEVNRKLFEKIFGESKRKHLSLHPLLTSSVLKKTDFCEERFWGEAIKLLPLSSAKNGTKFFENIEVRIR